MASKPVSRKPARQDDSSESQGPRRAVPRYSLRQALSVPQAITDNFGGKPTAPHQLAMALNFSPTSSAWDILLASAGVYGLTKGSRRANRIELTELGRRASAPTEEGDDL